MNFRDRRSACKLPYSPLSLSLSFFATTCRRAVKTEIMPARNIRCRTTRESEWGWGWISFYVRSPAPWPAATLSASRGVFYWNARHARVRYPSGLPETLQTEVRGLGGRLGRRDRTESEQEVSGPDVKFSASLSCNRRSPKRSKTYRSNLRQYVGRHHRRNEFQARRL